MPRTSLLFVEDSPDGSYGGSKKSLNKLISGLDPADWDAQVVYYTPGPYVEDARRLGARVQVLDAVRRAAAEPKAGRTHGPPGVTTTPTGEVHRSWPRQLARDARSWLHYAVRDARLAHRLRSSVPRPLHLIHFNGPMTERFEWARLAGWLRVPFITHERGVWRSRPAAWRLVARRAASIVCLTEERQARLRAVCGPGIRTRVIPNAIDPAAFEPRRAPSIVRSEVGAAGGVPLIVTAGHYRRWKGQDLGIEAARRLAGRGLAFRWVFFGDPQEPDYREELAALVQRHGLGDRIALLEHRDDVADLMAAADLAVHTSIHPEPFGRVLIEAMCVRTPVVAPNEGGPASIIRDGLDGSLYAPRDPDSLADAVAHLLGDRHALARMGSEARKRVEEHFSLARQMDRIRALYREVLSPES